jgi:hypothetical protein
LSLFKILQYLTTYCVHRLQSFSLVQSKLHKHNSASLIHQCTPSSHDSYWYIAGIQ